MRLYSTPVTAGSATVGNDDHGHYDVDGAGFVEVPDELGGFLNGLHIDGQRAWETEAQHSDRLAAEDLERRRDPAAIYDLFNEKLGSLAGFDPDVLVAAFAAALNKAQADPAGGRHEGADEQPKPRTRARKTADTEPAE